MLKLLWSRWHQELGELAMDVHGAPSMLARGAPYDLDDWQRLFLFSRADTIYGGSSEIQRNIIAERRSGCPGRHAGERSRRRPAPALPLPIPPPGRDLLAGKVAVITAAAGTGIGSAVARRCLDEGAQVVLSDHHERRLDSIRAELAEAHGDRVWSHPCDVTAAGGADTLVAAAVRGSAGSTCSSTTPAWAAPPRCWR